jgi:hypothetical protein
MNFFCVPLRARSGAEEISALLSRFQSLFSFLGHESAILTSQECDRLAFTMLNLVHRTLARVFIGTPPQKSYAVPKSAARKMVIGHFHYDPWIDWFPFAGAVRAPTAGASRRVASETR